MKKAFLLVALLATMFTQNSFAQDSTASPLLKAYYGIKDALVSGNSNAASSSAEEFVQSAGSIDHALISETDINKLVKDGTDISQSKDLSKQRILFASLSVNMFTVAKASKLTGKPVYQAYCPMKKAYWLSSDKSIKNPYYGNAMLTCGKIVETIN